MQELLRLTFQGEPKAVQSCRFAKIGNYIKKYQPKEVINWKNWIKLQTLNQLNEGWQPIARNIALGINVHFIFTPPKSMPKRILKFVDGRYIPKITRPDLTDNLMKGLIDALTGIIWQDDAQIAEAHAFKVYGHQTRTELTIYKLWRGENAE